MLLYERGGLDSLASDAKFHQHFVREAQGVWSCVE